MAKECVFCAIASGAAEAHVVFDDGEQAGAAGCMAFLDRTPLFKGHVLVVPRAHLETLADVPPDVLGPLFVHAQRVARVMETELGAAGSFVAMNNRISQSVPHLHVHVVPRNPKDGLKGFFWPRTRYADDAEMAGYARRLRVALG